MHELFVTTRPKTKVRPSFTNNMLTDINLSKVRMTKKINLMDLCDFR